MLSSLAADRARIVEIRSQISELESLLAALRDEQATAQQRLDSYIYPILTLPNEITAEIFLHFLPNYPKLPDIDHSRSHDAVLPIRLTHVCREWREVAITTPSLWKGLAIVEPRLLRKFEGRLALIETWLGRSGCCPLSIDIMMITGRRNYFVQNTFSVILPSLARLERLRLVLYHFQSVPHISLPMPSLRTLELGTLEGDEGPAAFASCDMPRLREVVLNNPSSLNVDLPWAQLTSLSLGCIEPDLCLPILQKTLNLVSCVLSFGSLSYEQYTITDHNIKLPCLTLLIIRREYRETVTGILTALLVPQLRRMEIPEPFLGSNPIASLKGFISESNCALKELVITNRKARRTGGPVTVEDYRAACPSVVDFSSEFIPPDDDDGDSDTSDNSEDDWEDDGSE
ncbi:F-box domain-containing protein [Favolaschia claudopus]|uniref:F-box domain-containing protein n=1 Tax=Favolaschia claudopus TaxID=2862362 RepID=A0AAW0CB44_9AGAR